jgi:hypothetical protein
VEHVGRKNFRAAGGEGAEEFVFFLVFFGVDEGLEGVAVF